MKSKTHGHWTSRHPPKRCTESSFHLSPQTGVRPTPVFLLQKYGGEETKMTAYEMPCGHGCTEPPSRNFKTTTGTSSRRIWNFRMKSTVSITQAQAQTPPQELSPPPLEFVKSLRKQLAQSKPTTKRLQEQVKNLQQLTQNHHSSQPSTTTSDARVTAEA